MGEVFCGAHVSQRVPVAVKVMAGRAVEDTRIQEAFRNEVRAVARLHHRNIVMIFDQGLVDRAAATASAGRLNAGSPYLAMELVTGGTLDVARRVLDWSLLRELLLDILDALAHAHARGVLHRDLKPANVLLPGKEDLRPGIKVTDFGIARAMEATDRAGEYEIGVSGTLRYMAPEHDGDELMHCHLHATPAPLEPIYAVPSGFESWVERLLAKRPANRFQRAADAAWALKDLSAAGVHAVPSAFSVSGTVENGSPKVVDSGEQTQPELIGEGWIDADGDTAAGISPDGDTAAVSVDRLEAEADTADRAEAPTDAAQVPLFLNWWEAAEDLAERAEVPPLPSSWRRPPLLLPSMRLVGAGLGLYGLRPIPMVARDRERDLIWTRLREARERRRTRLLVLHGESGYGKSRTVEWISQRAHEVGGATVLRASHSLISGPADGLPRMFANHLRCVGLESAQVLDRCRRFTSERPLPDDGDSDQEAAEIAALISSDAAGLHRHAAEGDSTDGDAAEPTGARLATPADRYRAARRVLARLCRRPVLLWLDDVHWGSDALAFADFLLTADHTTPLPLFVVMTYNDDQLIPRPLEAAQLEMLWSRSGVDRIRIEPLGEEDHVSLVQRLIGLSGDLVQQVAARTAGNPLFAVQLIGDWVQRGVLNVSDHGFDINPNESAVLPDDIHGLWTDRVRRIAARCEDATVEAALSCMEVAAALEQEVTDAEWRHACELAAQPIPSQLLDLLVSHRLAIAEGDAWSFSHSMLRESLERQSREAGRFPYLHRACALMLAKRYGTGDPAVAERRGRHLLAAGEIEQALEPLLSGAEYRSSTGDFRLAHALCEERERAMRALGVAADDPRWGDGWVRRARAHVTMCEHDKAAELADHALESAAQYNWQKIQARAHAARGYLGIGQGDTKAAHAAFASALEMFRRLDDPTGLADCLAGFGSACRWRHALQDASRYYDEAYALHTEESRLLLERAQRRFEQRGNRYQVACCLNDLGEVTRKAGDLRGAERLYRESAQLFESLGSADASTPRFNLGMVLLHADEYADARAVFEKELGKLAIEERALDKLWLHAGLLPCAAAGRDWAAWDHHMRRVVALVEEIVDEDIPWCAELAGRLAREAGATERSRRAFEIARSQWQRMEREPDIARVDAALASES